MNLTRRLKQSILNRMFRRPAVLNDAIRKALDNPQLLQNLLSEPDSRMKLLNAISQHPNAGKEVIQHPDMTKHIAREPALFEAMLKKTAHQPEVLLKILSQREIRVRLSAQNSFLMALAKDKNTAAKIVENIPTEDIKDTATIMFKRYGNQIKPNDSTPSDLELTLLATASDGEDTVREILLADMLVAQLGDNLQPLLAQIVIRQPAVLKDLLKDPVFYDSIVNSLEPDSAMLLDVMENYIIEAQEAPTTAQRISLLFSTILSKKVIKKSMADTPQLRDEVLAKVDDIYTSTGNSLEDALPHAREALKSRDMNAKSGTTT